MEITEVKSQGFTKHKIRKPKQGKHWDSYLADSQHPKSIGYYCQKK